MKVTVVSRGGRDILRGPLDLSDSATVADLQEAFHKRVLKDLGAQVSYRTLFFFEYLGPLLIYPVFYYFPVYSFLGYGQDRVIHPVQTYAMYYWCFHYFKRIMETFFVHRFSHATSPVANVFRNCAYYWTFGAYIAYYVNHPSYTPVSDLQMKIGFGRVPDSTWFPLQHYYMCKLQDRDLPVAWTVAGYVFFAVAALIMTNWALGKHSRLRKIFDGKDGEQNYPRRWVILPPFL
ncbi:hypothetical protein YC2023_077628 [Brassica napus]